MKQVLFSLLIALMLYACSESKKEPSKVQSNEQTIAAIDSIVHYANDNKKMFDEIPLLSDDFGSEYSFINMYSENGKSKIILEQMGNDSAFFENHYYLDDALELVYFTSIGTSILTKQVGYKRLAYFNHSRLLKDSREITNLEKYAVKNIIDRISEIKEIANLS